MNEPYQRVSEPLPNTRKMLTGAIDGALIGGLLLSPMALRSEQPRRILRAGLVGGAAVAGAMIGLKSYH